MYTLPPEIVDLVFEHLPPQDLINLSITCKRFYKIAQKQVLKLNPKIVQENALTLWNYPEGNFIVDSRGRLAVIAFYHLIARFSKWYDYRNVAEKVNDTVFATLREIYRLNQQGYIKREPSKPVPRCPCQHVSTGSIPRRFYVWDLSRFSTSPYYPAYCLADKILSTKQFSESRIHKVALLVKGQANLYNKIRKKYGLLDNAPDERIAKSNLNISEALFCKNFQPKPSSPFSFMS